MSSVARYKRAATRSLRTSHNLTTQHGPSRICQLCNSAKDHPEATGQQVYAAYMAPKQGKRAMKYTFIGRIVKCITTCVGLGHRAES